MGKITKRTRRESYQNMTPDTIYKKIVSILKNADRPLSARQISECMYLDKCIPYPVRQAVAPRLTELVEAGKVEACGKVYDKLTKRCVAVYKLVEGSR